MDIQWKMIALSDKELIDGFYRHENLRNTKATYSNN